MTPHVEGPLAMGALKRALLFGALAAAILVAVNAYWPAKWNQTVDEHTRDRAVLLVSGALVAISLWNLSRGLIHWIRWRTARRRERMLDDPATAPLVPPLASHLESVHASLSGIRVISWLVVVAAAVLAFSMYGMLAALERVPFPHDGEACENLGLVALLLLGATISAGARYDDGGSPAQSYGSRRT